MLELTDYILTGMNQLCVNILVLFDLSKAFDIVDHSILLLKPRKYIFDDTLIKWFSFYLVGRSQAVVDENKNTSNWSNTTSGVSQGSILGPLLFVLYMNDLPEVVRHSKILLYINDYQIYLKCPFHLLEEGIRQINEDANNFANWVSRNLLTLNIRKTVAMIFDTKTFISRNDWNSIPPIVVNGQHIRYFDIVKIWDSNLLWKNHINKISNRVNLTLFMLKMHRNSLSHSIRQKLVQSLIFPIFDYSFVVYNSCDATQNKRLEKAHNACIRFFSGFRVIFISHYIVIKLNGSLFQIGDYIF